MFHVKHCLRPDRLPAPRTLNDQYYPQSADQKEEKIKAILLQYKAIYTARGDYTDEPI